MSNIKLAWLADELESAGLNVDRHTGWATRTSPTQNTYEPVALLNHHTAGSSILFNYPDPPYWTNARLEDSCNITIRPDGVVAVLNAGYAYDSGQGDPKVLARLLADEPPTAPVDFTSASRVNGNPHFIDIEVQHKGDGSPIVGVQRDALIRTNAVILAHYGWNPWTHLLGHRDWTTRKIDPRWNGFSNPMHAIRYDTAQLLEETVATPGQKLMVDLAFNLFPAEVTGEPDYWKELPDDDAAWDTDFAPALSRGAQNLYVKLRDHSHGATGVTPDDVKAIINDSQIVAPA